jgi:hypothetical protein
MPESLALDHATLQFTMMDYQRTVSATLITVNTTTYCLN